LTFSSAAQSTLRRDDHSPRAAPDGPICWSMAPHTRSMAANEKAKASAVARQPLQACSAPPKPQALKRRRSRKGSAEVGQPPAWRTRCAGWSRQAESPGAEPPGANGPLAQAAPRAVPQAAPHSADELEAIVISLERRPDRMAGCEARLREFCPGLRYSRFTATDGRLTAIPDSDAVRKWHTGRNVVYQRLRAVRKGWNDLDSYTERELELSPGERGCASSHIRAWRHCIEQARGTEKPLLVLEDDAAPTADFWPLLRGALAALPADAHVLYLGYSQAADWKREISPELVEAEYVWTTVGYIVWPAGARVLLSKLPVDQPVDNYMAALCAAGDVKAYAVRPKVVRQAEPWNVNSDVAHSDEHYWGADSDITHSDCLYWG